uniref:Uncharacterized protein n=1 Tax=Candidatus Kentrum sp. FW TaxID=2126338 RepID=A0A450TQN8_9GAMM|nr:MAG: hypothetical protein BECKFW1821A_GA0114235_103521 [Candidatus Kentron sp. FW]VFJ70395.1 MAG: hypothetical protein BECKFW1821C_GA0114237_10231 [Candidatus Kentron sp. FW]
MKGGLHVWLVKVVQWCRFVCSRRSVFPGIAELYSASLGFHVIFAEYNSAIPDCPKRTGRGLSSPASKVRGKASLKFELPTNFPEAPVPSVPVLSINPLFLFPIVLVIAVRHHGPQPVYADAFQIVEEITPEFEGRQDQGFGQPSARGR